MPRVTENPSPALVANLFGLFFKKTLQIECNVPDATASMLEMYNTGIKLNELKTHVKSRSISAENNKRNKSIDGISKMSCDCC